MKRIIPLFLLLSLLLSACGDRIREPVTFYYVRANYEQDMSAIIASEEREASGHRNDLSYLLALYFMGPADEDLQSPVPRSTSLFNIFREDSTITLDLSDTATTMTDAEFTLACSCLTLTCLEITDAESVVINSGSRSLTMNAETLILKDLTTAAETEENP